MGSEPIAASAISTAPPSRRAGRKRRPATASASRSTTHVHTEDHPLEYLAFEGVIPRGEYGGGTMIVWDRGRWIPEGDPRAAYKKGHLAFTLEGERLRGRWHLVRTRLKPGQKKEQWLLLKADDAFARPPDAPAIIDEEITSIISGRSNEDLAAEGEVRTDHADRAKAAAGRKTVSPDLTKIPGAKKGILPVSGSPLSPPSSRRRPPDRSGSTRSSSTATGSRPASTAARSSS